MQTLGPGPGRKDFSVSAMSVVKVAVPQRRVAAHLCKAQAVKRDLRRRPHGSHQMDRRVFGQGRVRGNGKGRCWHGGHFSGGQHKEQPAQPNVPARGAKGKARKEKKPGRAFAQPGVL